MLRHSLISLIALSAAAAASAQAMDAFDAHASNIRFLEARKVQTELGITEAQRSRMNKHADTYRADLKAYEAELKKKGVDVKTLKAPDARMRSINGKLRQNVFSELKPAQLKRLREISLQTVGLVAVLDTKVAAKVGVSATQLKQMRDLYTAGSKQADALMKKEVGGALASFKGANPKTDSEKKKLKDQAEAKVKAAQERIAPQVENVRKQTRDRMLAVMTPAQESAFMALQGKKFTPA